MRKPQHPPHIRHAAASALLLWILAGALLGGCGFQLRGQGIDPATLPSPIAIVGLGPFTDLRREIEDQLRQAGVEVSATATAATTVLNVSGWRSDTRLLSVNSRNKAVEFVLEESADFSLQGGDGRVLLPSQSLQVRRIQYRPENAILGSDNESEQLRRDMRRDLVAQMLRRIAAR